MNIRPDVYRDLVNLRAESVQAREGKPIYFSDMIELLMKHVDEDKFVEAIKKVVNTKERGKK